MNVNIKLKSIIIDSESLDSSLSTTNEVDNGRNLEGIPSKRTQHVYNKYDNFKLIYSSVIT